MNLEPILRKIIQANMFAFYDGYGKKKWSFTYEDIHFEKPFLKQETIAQVVDWFYSQVLQYENKNQDEQL